MSELDEIRKRKLESLMELQQERLHQQSQEQAQLQQQIEHMENAVKQLFTKEALARYGSLKTAHHESSLQLLLILFQAMQKGQVQGRIDDSTLKKIIQQITPKKREINIKRV